MTFAKTCTPTTFPKKASTNCTISITNPSFEPANVVITDALPKQLKLTSVSGATQIDDRNLSFSGVLAPQSPADVAIAPGVSPRGLFAAR